MDMFLCLTESQWYMYLKIGTVILNIISYIETKQFLSYQTEDSDWILPVQLDRWE